jgi:hypothetical protein
MQSHSSLGNTATGDSETPTSTPADLCDLLESAIAACVDEDEAFAQHLLPQAAPRYAFIEAITAMQKAQLFIASGNATGERL